MRGFRTNSQYSAGFVSGILFTVLVAGLVRLAEWAASTDVVAAVTAWATTPSISPAGLVLNLVPLLVILLIAFVLTGYLGMMPRSRP